MKVIFITTFIESIELFHLPYLKYFKDNGWEVHVAAKGTKSLPFCDKQYNIPFIRMPFNLRNIKAYKELKIIMNNEKFDIVHCHSPIGGALAKLTAAKYRKSGTKVIYTAHGFHFYKGAPLKNRLFYFVEKFFSYFTDALITINQEDFQIAKSKLKAKKIYYVPGVGVNKKKIEETVFDKSEFRKSLGLSDDDIMLLSVGELNKNKNHRIVIEAMAKIKNKKLHYFIAGKGQLEPYLIELSFKNGIVNNVHFLGFRSDIYELCKSADIFCFPSLREGLPLSVMEAMSASLPCVCSKIRGNIDLIKDPEMLVNPNDAQGFAHIIKKLSDDPMLRKEKGQENNVFVNNFDISNVLKIMQNIYLEVLSI